MSRPARRRPSLERELTLAVPGGVVLPDLDAVAGTTRGAVRVHDLRATYLDTPTWSLLRRGLTLRRRTGGEDDGWHLKVPAGGHHPGAGASGVVARDEHHEPIAQRSQVAPRRLRRLVTALVLHEPLGPVAVLHTHRVSVPLLDEDGRRWATLTDDTVTAHRERARHGDDLEVVAWREWEVELAEDRDGADEGADDDADDVAGRLEALVAALRDAGATDPPTTSKLRRALGDLPLPRPWTGRPRSAHELAALRIGDLAERLRVEDLRWRTADPTAREGTGGASVHRFRTTVRRLRSVLQTYGVALDPGRDGDPHGPVAHARDELRWLGGELGAHRDAEVLRDRLQAQLTALTRAGEGPGDPRPVVTAVVALVDEALGARRAAGARRIDRALASARYVALLAALDELAVPPRPEEEDGRAVRREVSALVTRDVRRLRRAVRTADAADPGPARDTALHEARKRAKRLRYAADAARPVLRRGATRLARRARTVQEALGDHQDAVVARDAVRDLVAAVPRSPRLEAPGAAARAGFLLGRLDGAQTVAARDAVAAYDAARARLPRHAERLLGS